MSLSYSHKNMIIYHLPHTLLSIGPHLYKNLTFKRALVFPDNDVYLNACNQNNLSMHCFRLLFVCLCIIWASWNRQRDLDILMEQVDPTI